MGTYLISTAPGSQLASQGSGNSGVVISQDESAPVLGPNQQQDRDVVLVNLATYREQ